MIGRRKQSEEEHSKARKRNLIFTFFLPTHAQLFIYFKAQIQHYLHVWSLSQLLRQSAYTFRLFVCNSIRALSVATIFSRISCLVEHKASGILAQGLALKMSVEQMSEQLLV